nr:PREDICTED: centromere protein T [Paralichthys olivaceus]
MDLTEDLSARVLLKNILSTETPRTPITRSSSKPVSTRRSSRLSKRDAGAQTPQDILRRSLKHKMRESITRKSLPPTTRRTASAGLRNINTPAPTSMLFDEGETPRHILRNILLTEPVKSPVIHEKAASEEPQLISANSSITSKRPSIELSGLDLPDLTLGNAASIAKGLSRKRPHRSLNVTAFEKRLKGASDVGEESEVSIDDHSSLSLSSSTSLSLKTPFVDVRMERRGLQRRVANRRKVTAEEFGAGVNKWQMEDDREQPEDLNMTTYSEGFTLGLSVLSVPDVSADIVNCNTALYSEPNSMTSSLSIVETQDKRETSDMEQNEPEKEKSVHVSPTEGGVAVESQSEEYVSDGQSEKDVDTAECQEEEMKRTSDGENDDEEENRVEAQTEEEGAADPQTEGEEEDSQPEEDVAVRSQSEAEEVAPDSQTEEEDGVDSQPGEDVAARSEEEEVTPDSQTEEEEEGAVDSQSVEEGDAEEYQSDQEDPAANSQSEEDEHDGKQEEEEDGEQASELLEHISRRAQRSQGGLIVPMPGAGGDLQDATEEGWSEDKAHSAIKQRESSHPHSEMPDVAESSTRGQNDDSQSEAESDAWKENPLLSLDLMNDIVDGDHLSDASPEEEAGALDPAEQGEEWEDEDGEENKDFSCETPAFVREKRNFFKPDPLASPSLQKNIQASSTSGTSEALPAAKPKQVQRKKRTPAKNKATPPKSYLMSVFRHFAKAKVSADVYPVLDEVMDKFLERLADDLETYAGHAKRKTIEVEDAVLLLKRQGHVNDKVPVEVLIEKYLRMEQRKLLIPIATSGNVVIPKKHI